MAWRVEFAKGAQKDLAKLDATGRERILWFLHEHIQNSTDPRSRGEPLKGPEVGKYWKICVGDYRMICDLQDALLIVLVVRVGHRREIYR